MHPRLQPRALVERQRGMLASALSTVPRWVAIQDDCYKIAAGVLLEMDNVGAKYFGRVWPLMLWSLLFVARARRKGSRTLGSHD